MNIEELQKDGLDKLEKEAQFSVIVSLQSKIEKLQEENNHLKLLLEQNTPIIGNSSEQVLGISNEQLICEVQIKLLKDRAIVKELNKDEAQRLQIYVDILERLNKSKPSEERSKIDNLSTEELVKLVDFGSGIV